MKPRAKQAAVQRARSAMRVDLTPALRWPTELTASEPGVSSIRSATNFCVRYPAGDAGWP